MCTTLYFDGICDNLIHNGARTVHCQNFRHQPITQAMNVTSYTFTGAMTHLAKIDKMKIINNRLKVFTATCKAH